MQWQSAHRLDGFKRVAMGLISEQGIDYQTMKYRLHKISMENWKSTGNWSLRLGNWTVSMQMEIGLGNFLVVFPYRVIQDSAAVSGVKIKTVSIISNFFL